MTMPQQMTLFGLARKGIGELFELQRKAVGL